MGTTCHELHYAIWLSTGKWNSLICFPYISAILNRNRPCFCVAHLIRSPSSLSIEGKQYNGFNLLVAYAENKCLSRQCLRNHNISICLELINPFFPRMDKNRAMCLRINYTICYLYKGNDLFNYHKWVERFLSQVLFLCESIFFWIKYLMSKINNKETIE